VGVRREPIVSMDGRIPLLFHFHATTVVSMDRSLTAFIVRFDGWQRQISGWWLTWNAEPGMLDAQRVVDNVSPVFKTDRCLHETNIWWSSWNSDMRQVPAISRNYVVNNREAMKLCLQ
jgi:hypothetical protein